MKSLWLINLLLIIGAAGCASIKPSDLTRASFPGTRDETGLLQYHAPIAAHLFKATLDIKKHHITGLLVIKRMPPADPPAPSQTGRGDSVGVYRIVFANEFGMTFFDLEMKADSFKVISCFESLNKKALMKILETDFRLLTGFDPFRPEKTYRQKLTGKQVYYGRAGRYKAWQTWSPKGDTLYAKAARSNLADPVIISLGNYSNGIPLGINLENPVIGMKIALRKLK